jgi:hypothetical protein
MYDVQTEIVDSLISEHYEGSVSGIGAVVDVTSTRVIRGGLVYNPTAGPNATNNGVNKYLRASLDGGDGWITIPYGGKLCFGIRPDDDTVKIDAGVSGGIGYEVILAVEK